MNSSVGLAICLQLYFGCAFARERPNLAKRHRIGSERQAGREGADSAEEQGDRGTGADYQQGRWEVHARGPGGRNLRAVARHAVLRVPTD